MNCMPTASLYMLRMRALPTEMIRAAVRNDFPYCGIYTQTLLTSEPVQAKRQKVTLKISAWACIGGGGRVEGQICGVWHWTHPGN